MIYGKKYQKIKEKRNIKNISLTLGIIILILLLLVGARTQSSKNGKLSTNINSSKIVQIKLIGKEPQGSSQSTFWLPSGYVTFYPKKESVYGEEIDNVKYAVDVYQGDSMDMSADGYPDNLGTNGPPKKYYDWIYENYLGVFDKVKTPRKNLLFGTRIIILNKKKLQSMYPKKLKKGAISWYYEAINLVSDPMVSLRILLDEEGRPIAVSAAAKSNPGHYRKLYKLSYNNNTSAYNRGFHKMLESIKHKSKQEPRDD